jgi:hypothetical protein
MIASESIVLYELGNPVGAACRDAVAASQAGVESLTNIRPESASSSPFDVKAQQQCEEIVLSEIPPLTADETASTMMQGQDLSSYVLRLKNTGQLPEDMGTAVAFYSAQNGAQIVRQPLRPPNGDNYALVGVIEKVDAPDEFLVDLNIQATIRGPAYRLPMYFRVKLSPGLRGTIGSKLHKGMVFKMVGTYVDNVVFASASGKGRMLPVFNALYVEPWN